MARHVRHNPRGSYCQRALRAKYQFVPSTNYTDFSIIPVMLSTIRPGEAQ